MLNPSMRALVLGSGNTVNVATGRAGGDTITFANDQNFKEGATIVNLASNLIWTVRGGSGKVWQMYQNIMIQGGGLAAAAFYTSDPGNTRVRNKDVTANYWGKIPQSGKVFTYLAYMDKDGNPDVYVYHDTLFPEKGRLEGRGYRRSCATAVATARTVRRTRERDQGLDLRGRPEGRRHLPAPERSLFRRWMRDSQSWAESNSTEMNQANNAFYANPGDCLSLSRVGG